MVAPDLSSASDFVIYFLCCKMPPIACISLQRRCKFTEGWTAKPLWKQVSWDVEFDYYLERKTYILFSNL